jgi:hypothetical protein
MNNIINKEIEVKVDNFLKVFEDLKKCDINKEIVRCIKIYKNCEGEFKDEKEEEYILSLINLKENIIDDMKYNF